MRLSSAVWFAAFTVAGAAALIAVITLPPHLTPADTTARAEAALEDQIRGTIAQTVGGMVVLAAAAVTGYFTLQRLRILERQVTAIEEGQITERFTRAIDQLGATHSDGSPIVEVRAGGIRALERIARESARDSESIRDILLAYVIAHSRLQDYGRESGSYPDAPPTGANRNPRARQMDLQSARRSLRSVLGARGAVEAPGGRIRLSFCDLPRLNLRDRNAQRAQLVRTVLDSALMDGADLTRANLGVSSLVLAKMNGSLLIEANLARCRMRAVRLRDADLTGVRARGADFRSARLTRAVLRRALLVSANFAQADLRNADLTDADLTDADLSRADLRGADLRGATLNRAKLDGCVWDDETKWPIAFEAPWSGPPPHYESEEEEDSYGD